VSRADVPRTVSGPLRTVSAAHRWHHWHDATPTHGPPHRYVTVRAPHLRHRHGPVHYRRAGNDMLTANEPSRVQALRHMFDIDEFLSLDSVDSQLRPGTHSLLDPIVTMSTRAVELIAVGHYIPLAARGAGTDEPLCPARTHWVAVNRAVSRMERVWDTRAERLCGFAVRPEPLEGPP